MSEQSTVTQQLRRRGIQYAADIEQRIYSHGKGHILYGLKVTKTDVDFPGLAKKVFLKGRVSIPDTGRDFPVKVKYVSDGGTYKVTVTEVRS